MFIFSCRSMVEVNTKIKKAYCPPEIVEKNPIVDYVRYIILPYYNKITINLQVYHSPLIFHMDSYAFNILNHFNDLIQDGPAEYVDYETFEADYLSAKIHPSELKPAVQTAINAILGMHMMFCVFVHIHVSVLNIINRRFFYNRAIGSHRGVNMGYQGEEGGAPIYWRYVAPKAS